MNKRIFPESLQAVLWSKSLANLELEQDKTYIIHQVLAYGLMEHLKWLFGVYPKSEIISVFLHYPVKIYTARSLNFLKILLFDNKNYQLDAKLYVQNPL